ncbi:MAG: hypothetical protein U1E78_09855 [Gammaproteobacteria bacterium]
MIFRVGAERSRRRSVHKVHDCDENREGNNPENSAVKGIVPQKPRTGVRKTQCRDVRIDFQGVGIPCSWCPSPSSI